MGCQALLQRIILTQGSNPCLMSVSRYFPFIRTPVVLDGATLLHCDLTPTGYICNDPALRLSHALWSWWSGLQPRDFERDSSVHRRHCFWPKSKLPWGFLPSHSLALVPHDAGWDEGCRPQAGGQVWGDPTLRERPPTPRDPLSKSALVPAPSGKRVLSRDATTSRPPFPTL